VSALDPVIDKMEPETKELGLLDTLGEAATISIAISLKRIADALAPVAGQDIGSTLFYIEQRLGPQS
jgi:hypothetical protein